MSKFVRRVVTAGVGAGIAAGGLLAAAPAASAATCVPVVNGDPGFGFCVAAAVYNPDPTSTGLGACARVDTYYELGGSSQHDTWWVGAAVELQPVDVYICPQ